MKVPIKLQAAYANFEKAREEMGAFRTANPKLVEMYERHVEAYNDALAEVKSLYRENSDEVGDNFYDFSIRHKTIIDASKLVELMGDVGLAVCKVKYAVDRKEYNKFVEEGTIPQEVVDEIESEAAPAVYGPKAL